MISVLVVGRVGVFRCEQGLALVVVRVEDVVVGEFGLVVVKTPDVQEDRGTLGDEFAVDPFI